METKTTTNLINYIYLLLKLSTFVIAIGLWFFPKMWFPALVVTILSIWDLINIYKDYKNFKELK
jgi:hypothetical protein